MNPDNVLYTSMIAVQNEGSSSAVICATASNGAEHTITNCSLVSNLPDKLGSIFSTLVRLPSRTRVEQCCALKHKKTALLLETSSEIQFRIYQFVNCPPLTKQIGNITCLVIFDL